MFKHVHDSAFGFAVMVFATPPSEDDADHYVAAVRTLDAMGAERDGSALVLVFEAGYPMPDAVLRKRFVEARKGMRSRPVVALVGAHPLMRASVIAARWISPPPFPQEATATFAEAVEWIESKRGPTLRVLDRLYAEVTADIATERRASGKHKHG